MRRLLIRAGALALLLAVLLVPLVLVWGVAAARPPSLGQLREAWQAGLVDGPTAIGLGAVVFTGVWAWLAVIAAAELVRTTSGRWPVSRPRGRTPAALVRALARVVVTAGAASLPVGSSVMATVLAPAGAVSPADAPGAVASATTTAMHHHVATGRDTAYSLAVELLGDAERRDDIVRMNIGRSGPDGRAWSSGAFPAGMPVVLPAPDPSLPPPGRDVLVESGDSWWSLAEEQLGDGRRWRELQDANVGVQQPSGDVVQRGSTTIHPGWVVHIAGPSPAAEPVPGNGVQYVVQPGDSLSGIVEAHFSTVTRAERAALVLTVFATNRGTTDPQGRSLDDPDLIHPGMVLTLPPAPSATSLEAPRTQLPVVEPAPAPPPSPTPAEQPEVRPDVAARRPPASRPAPVSVPRNGSFPPTAATTATATTTTTTALGGTDPDEDGAPPWVAASGVAGTTLLATGLGALVASRRRHRLLASRSGQSIRPVDQAAGTADRIVRRSSDAVAAARLDLAMRALAGRLRGSAARPQVVVRRVDGAIDVHLDRPRALESPWAPRGEGSVAWTLPAAVELEQLVADAAGVAPSCPALVTVGRDGDGDVMVDVEAVGGLAVDAPAAAAARVLRSIAVELAVTPLADLVHVVTCGLPLAGLDVPERLHHCGDVGAALELAHSLAPRTTGTAETGSTFARRASQGHEPWEPVVVVLPPDPDDSARPVDGIAPDGGAITVVGPARPGGWRLAHRHEAWVLEPLGWTISPVGLSDEDASAVAALVADASAPLVSATWHDDEPSSSLAATDHELLVRVLGTVDVVDRHGRPVDFDRPKALELVVWLAQHRASATRTAARTALWDLDVSNATFSNVVSDARRALARLVPPPEGEDWIARTYAEALPLHRSVALDADVVSAALESSRRTEDDAAAIETLRDALALIRGVPYTGVHYLWPDAEALPAQLTLLVTSVAHELARRCLALGEVDGVLGATAVGLGVLPGHEELVCLRMRALAAAGDRSAVRREFAGYERAVLVDPWSGGELADPVVALRNELLGASG